MASTVMILSALLMFVAVCTADIGEDVQQRHHITTTKSGYVFTQLQVAAATATCSCVVVTTEYRSGCVVASVCRQTDRLRQSYRKHFLTERIHGLQAPVTEVCLGCICQATTGCQQGKRCEGDTCGLFGITWAYWADAGKPTLQGEPVESPTAYSNCAIDPYCAARTVQGYMSRFAQDCNGDGRVDCYDYMAIHQKGGYGCTGDLPYKYVNVFNQCIAAVAANRG